MPASPAWRSHAGARGAGIPIYSQYWDRGAGSNGTGKGEHLRRRPARDGNGYTNYLCAIHFSVHTIPGRRDWRHKRAPG
ncbi:hypothetical protein Cs7R123_16010 [Catellatospora sp. TT07R-123]|nr:hypothetical protein Cs7R123_16010 [Catellatospora sp. TT07R-123]